MSLFGLGSRNQKTFRPKKNAPSGSRGAQLQKHIDATLGSGNLREAVRLPPGEDINEWLAVNSRVFFFILCNFISRQVSSMEFRYLHAFGEEWNWRLAVLFLFCSNDLYGDCARIIMPLRKFLIAEIAVLWFSLCSSSPCFFMKQVLTYIFALRYEYRWADGVTIKKPIEVSASKYVEYLMDWIEAQLDDELIFPQKLGAPFPPNFQDVVKTIFKRLFRVYAHIYHSHFQKIVSLKEEAHLNTCFKHFVLFAWVSFFSLCLSSKIMSHSFCVPYDLASEITGEFRLIDKGELAPLYDLVESILKL
ncbi:hypothetical protein SADUNF_Sadunf06G0117200 [Salix dunnii]|uniref:MOB kinase activator-like 1A n=1 Tax=Salix dunnii TaxID=1413687 RepID=A0A835K8U8_9ROSI|nr:hypothetical protein SADUNF_Sadunf06G0117200 [Salix dunnii]